MNNRILDGVEYTVSYVNLTRNHWRDGEVWSCIGQPKEYHLFLYLDGCSATYKMKDGREFVANPGEFMYVPKGVEYRAGFFSGGKQASTLGINFEINSKDGALFGLSDEICVFDGAQLRSLAEEAERLSYSLVKAKMRYNLILYSIINAISPDLGGQEENSSFGLIRTGVEYLHKHYDENTGVEALAAMCSVSAVYYRRLFKIYTGMSPTEYRTHLRLQSALELLRFGELSVSEISARLGFVDSAYFVKRFKERFGVTPLAYKKRKF